MMVQEMYARLRIFWGHILLDQLRTQERSLMSFQMHAALLEILASLKQN